VAASPEPYDPFEGFDSGSEVDDPKDQDYDDSDESAPKRPAGAQVRDMLGASRATCTMYQH
jgi:hypothetical protein